MERRPRGPADAAIVAAAPMIATALLVALLFYAGPSAATGLSEMIARIDRQALDFPAREIAVEAAMRHPAGYVPSYSGRWSSDLYRFELSYVMPIASAYLAVLLLLVWRMTTALDMAERIAFLFAAVAPASLLLVAFDLSRIMSIAILQSYATVAILLRYVPPSREVLDSAVNERRVALLLAANVLVAFPPLNSIPVFNTQLPGGVLDLPLWLIPRAGQ